MEMVKGLYKMNKERFNIGMGCIGNPWFSLRRVRRQTSDRLQQERILNIIDE